jgi:hypothetical protein
MVRVENDRGWRTILMKERPNQLRLRAVFERRSDRDRTPRGICADWHRRPRDYCAECRGFGTPDAHRHGLWRGRLKIYVNGVLERNNAVSGNAPISGDPLRMGGNTVALDEFFSGTMDEVRVYDRALSDLEIRDDMQAPVIFGTPSSLTATTAGPVAAYNFDDGTATNVLGHGHDGVSNGRVAAAGLHGQALSFDGINDLVSISDHADLDFTAGMTLEAWVNPTALGAPTRGLPATIARHSRRQHFLSMSGRTWWPLMTAAGQLTMWVNGVVMSR